MNDKKFRLQIKKLEKLLKSLDSETLIIAREIINEELDKRES